MENLRLDRLEYGVSDVGAGVYYLDTDELALLVELRRYIRTELDARSLMVVGDTHVKDVLFLKIPHVWLSHSGTSRT